MCRRQHFGIAGGVAQNGILAACAGHPAAAERRCSPERNSLPGLSLNLIPRRATRMSDKPLPDYTPLLRLNGHPPGAWAEDPPATGAGSRTRTLSGGFGRTQSFGCRGKTGQVFSVSRETFLPKTAFPVPQCYRNPGKNAEVQFVQTFQDGCECVKIGRIRIIRSKGVYRWPNEKEKNQNTSAGGCNLC